MGMENGSKQSYCEMSVVVGCSRLDPPRVWRRGGAHLVGFTPDFLVSIV